MLLMRGARVIFDLNVDSCEDRVLQALDDLMPEVWIYILKDSLANYWFDGLDSEVLDRGIGNVSPISIHRSIWDLFVVVDETCAL